MISIVETTCQAAQDLQLHRPGLFGTRFTMQGRFYQQVFAQAGIDLVLPDNAEQEEIHTRYLLELVQGVLRAETRETLLTIAQRLKRDERIEGVILGGCTGSYIMKVRQRWWRGRCTGSGSDRDK